MRLDSGDLDDLSRRDEDAVARLVAAGAPIDSFGIGTAMTTSADHPYLDAVYKLQEYAGRPRRKRSTGKATWPGRKQVYRRYAADGTPAGDVVTLQDDVQNGEPLLACVMQRGRRLSQPSLEESRKHCLRQLARLPTAFPYPVEISPALRTAADAVDRSLLNTRSIVGS